MTAAPEPERYAPAWLRLREPADARSRSAELARLLAEDLASDLASDLAAEGSGARRPLVVHDLGCGSGSMSRWLAPRLPGPQRWVLHDRDPLLLRLAAGSLPATAADGTPVTAQVRVGDVTGLTAADLAGADVVTASALLDLLTAAELTALAAACAGAGCRALFALSVAGGAELDPGDPLDAAVAAAFDDHQRRQVAGRHLLGPDAGDAAAAALAAAGLAVEVRRTPWELGPGDAALTAEWLRGWAGAAAEQRPELPLEAYLERRLAQAAAGTLRARVHHVDVLARGVRTLSPGRLV